MGTKEIMESFHRRAHSKPLGLNLKPDRSAPQIGSITVKSQVDYKFIREKLRTIGSNPHAAARAAGVSSTSMHHICRGEVSAPRINTLKKIADFLGVPVERLWGGGRS